MPRSLYENKDPGVDWYREVVPQEGVAVKGELFRRTEGCIRVTGDSTNRRAISHTGGTLDSTFTGSATTRRTRLQRVRRRLRRCSRGHWGRTNDLSNYRLLFCLLSEVAKGKFVVYPSL